jgi:hypothetical protein
MCKNNHTSRKKRLKTSQMSKSVVSSRRHCCYGPCNTSFSHKLLKMESHPQKSNALKAYSIHTETGRGPTSEFQPLSRQKFK